MINSLDAMIKAVSTPTTTLHAQKDSRKKKCVAYTSLGTAGAIVGYLIPDKERISPMEMLMILKKKYIKPKIKKKIIIGGNGYEEEIRANLKNNSKNFKFSKKWINSVIGAVVGLVSAYLIWGRKQKTNEN